MIAAARAGVATVELEFLGAEARLPRFLVQRFVIAISSRHDVAGCTFTRSITPGSGVVTTHAARIARRRVTFDHDRALGAERMRRVLDRR